MPEKPTMHAPATQADEPQFTVRLRTASAVGIAGAAAVEAAAMAGLDTEVGRQLGALTSEVVRAVVADSFDGAEDIDIAVAVVTDSGTLSVVITDQGAPSKFTVGDLPPRVNALIALGFADGVSFANKGLAGNRVELRKEMPSRALHDDAEFVAALAAENPPAEVSGEDITYRRMTADDVVGVARLYYRTYGYTKVGAGYIYQPETFAGMLRTGHHIGQIAVTPAGRVVGHLGFGRRDVTSTVGSSGPTAVEPAFRRHGIGLQLMQHMFPILIELGMTGTISEAVTVHPASQRLADQVGGNPVGFVLSRQPGDLEFRAIDDGTEGQRRAVAVYYLGFGDRAPSTVHMPPVYADVARRIYERNGLQRDLAPAVVHVGEVAERTEFVVDLTPQTRYARLDVKHFGRDFLVELQQRLASLERGGYELVQLGLPLADPLTSYFGAGLSELGLFLNAVLPDAAGRDTLLLGRTRLMQEPDSIKVSNEFSEWLLAYVLADYQRAVAGAEQRARSRAQLARIFEAM